MKFLRQTAWAVVVPAFVLANAMPLRAQAVYGSIAGTVTDSTGASVPGATVTITSPDRNTADLVVTNATGNFKKDRLLPGRYEVKAELTGFKAQLVPKVVVSVDTQTQLSLRLETGDISETITVEATAGQLLKTDRADVATVFDEQQLTELPVLDRNFTKFLLLTPGTQQMTWNHAASENPQGSTQTIVNGSSFSGTGWQLDGTDNRDPILGIIVINPNLESIGETKVTSQNYDAEFGQAVAGVVSVQTKSGTNELHGSAFGFYQSDKFQARNPFSQPDTVNPVTGRVLPESKKQQFGASLGGPIVKNQWFWFADYQGSRNTNGGSRLLTVPTAAARRGDLSLYGVNIFDPLTGTPDQRSQFPGNVIPAGRLSPQTQAILGLLPLPNTPGRDNGTRDNYSAQGSEKFNADQADVRFDGRLSPGFNLFGRYTFAQFDLNGPTAFGEGGGGELVSLGGNSKVKNHSVAAGFDYTLNNTTILDFRFGFYQYKVDVFPFDFGTSPATAAGIPGLNVDDFSSGLPALYIARDADRDFRMGSGLGVNRCNCPLAQDEKQWQVVTNLTKLLGNHTVKFGIDIRRAYNLRVPSDIHRAGEIDFNVDRTRGPNGGGSGLATFLLGDATSFARYVSPNTDSRERQWRQFYYVQDTWRATPKLTLNYGLRLDIFNPQTMNEAGNGGYLDINTGEIRVAGVGEVDLAGNVTNKLNFAPRLGVSYQINDKTVLRAGYGRSYDTGVFGSIFGHSVTQNLPVLSVQQLSAPNNFDSVFNLRDGPPAPVFLTPGPNGRFDLPNGVRTFLLRDEQRVPALDAWNVSLQRQITNTLSVELAYVANRSTRAMIGDGPDTNFNQPTIQGFGTLNRDQRKPFFNGPQGGYGANFGWTQDIAYFCNCGKTTYNSLQAKIEKRFAAGYSLLAHYTFQKANQNDGSYFFFDPDLNYGPQQFGRDHNFVLSGIFELPFGQGKKFATGASGLSQAIVGNWQANFNAFIQSGTPFDVSYAGAGADRDTGPNRPDLIGDANGPQTADQWFNATPIGSAGSAFGRPAVGTFGDMPRNMLRGPGYWRVDASLFKRFMVGTKSNLELRLEVVNLFNHVNLGNPNSEVGTATDPRPDAGRITSTAFFGADAQRNLQFGLRFQF